MRTLTLTLLEGVATNLPSIEFKVAYYGFQIHDQLSPSIRQMFRWSKNEFVLKPLEMRQSLSELPCANVKMIKQRKTNNMFFAYLYTIERPGMSVLCVVIWDDNVFTIITQV